MTLLTDSHPPGRDHLRDILRTRLHLSIPDLSSAMTNVMTWATLALCFIIPLLAAEIMGFFSWKNHFDVNGKVRKSCKHLRIGIKY